MFFANTFVVAVNSKGCFIPEKIEYLLWNKRWSPYPHTATGHPTPFIDSHTASKGYLESIKLYCKRKNMTAGRKATQWKAKPDARRHMSHKEYMNTTNWQGVTWSCYQGWKARPPARQNMSHKEHMRSQQLTWRNVIKLSWLKTYIHC